MEQIGLVLLIVAFSVVRALVRRAGKQGKTGLEPTAPSLVGWLKRLKGEIEAAHSREEATKGGVRGPEHTGALWSELFGRGSTPEPPAAWDTHDEIPRDGAEVSEAPHTEVEARRPVEPEPAPPVSVAPWDATARPGFGPAHLRQAVIWSEILGPPTALRE